MRQRYVYIAVPDGKAVAVVVCYDTKLCDVATTGVVPSKAAGSEFGHIHSEVVREHGLRTVNRRVEAVDFLLGYRVEKSDNLVEAQQSAFVVTVELEAGVLDALATFVRLLSARMILTSVFRAASLTSSTPVRHMPMRGTTSEAGSPPSHASPTVATTFPTISTAYCAVTLLTSAECTATADCDEPAGAGAGARVEPAD